MDGLVSSRVIIGLRFKIDECLSLPVSLSGQAPGWPDDIVKKSPKMKPNELFVKN
jgi:hypothetical protein